MKDDIQEKKIPLDKNFFEKILVSLMFKPSSYLFTSINRLCEFVLAKLCSSSLRFVHKINENILPTILLILTNAATENIMFSMHDIF